MHFGPTLQEYYLPDVLLQKLEKIPSRDPWTGKIHLADVDASIGHVLIHFLHTGVYQTLKDEGVDFSKIKGLSGAGMQHGTVFWSKEAESLLSSLDSNKTLLEQLSNEQKSAFAHPHSPNWQDASTQKQCDKFDEQLKDPETLAQVTGSKAHHVRISVSRPR